MTLETSELTTSTGEKGDQESRRVEEPLWLVAKFVTSWALLHKVKIETSERRNHVALFQRL